MPQINEPEKVYLLASFSGGTQEDYANYYALITNPDEYFRRYEMKISPVLLEPTNLPSEDNGKPRIAKDVNGVIKIDNHNWILDPFVKGATRQQTDIKVSDVDTLKKLKELKSQIKPPTSDFHSSMICLYSGPMNNTGMRFLQLLPYFYRNCYCYRHYYKHYCISGGAGWLHTGDIDLKNITSTADFSKYYQSYIDHGFVSVMQIPHHCSSHNHDKHFDDIFNGISNRIFYFTYSISGGGNTKPHPTDIQNVENLLPVSEYSPLFIGTVR